MPRVANSRPPCQDIVEKLMPSCAVHLLAGAPGAGKTTLAALMLKDIAAGRPVFGFRSTPPPYIGVIAGDRGWSSHAEWFARVGWADIPHYSMQDDPDFNWDVLEQSRGFFQILLDSLHHLGNIPVGSLVLIDPISTFLGGDLMNYNRIYRVLGELGQLCIKRSLTILGTCHAGKQRANKSERYARPWDRILGSSALVGFSDTVFYLATPYETGHQHSELHWAPHHAPAGSVQLRRDKDTGLFIPAYASDAERSKTLDASITHVLALVTAEPITSDTILDLAATQHQLSRATVFRALNELAVSGLIRSVSRGVWKKLLKN